MAVLILAMKRAGNIRVMKDALEVEGFSVVPVADHDELEAVLRRSDRDHVGLVDAAEFGQSVWQMCETLHARNVRFLVLSAGERGAVESRALGHGAAGFLQKPVGKSALVQLLKSLTA